MRSARIGVILLASVIGMPLASCAENRTSESTGQYVDDATITTKVKTALVRDQSLKGFEIGVETYKDVVQLSGFVDTKQAAQRAQEVAAKVEGVRSVHNDIIVK